MTWRDELQAEARAYKGGGWGFTHITIVKKDFLVNVRQLYIHRPAYSYAFPGCRRDMMLNLQCDGSDDQPSPGSMWSRFLFHTRFSVPLVACHAQMEMEL